MRCDTETQHMTALARISYVASNIMLEWFAWHSDQRMNPDRQARVHAWTIAGTTMGQHDHPRLHSEHEHTEHGRKHQTAQSSPESRSNTRDLAHLID